MRSMKMVMKMMTKGERLFAIDPGLPFVLPSDDCEESVYECSGRGEIRIVATNKARETAYNIQMSRCMLRSYSRFRVE